MDGNAAREVAGLLGVFSDGFTQVFDQVFGTDWTENDEILALLRIATVDGTSTRVIAEASGLGRRAVSRMVSRLRDAGVVTAERSPVDARSIVVVLTPRGRTLVRSLPVEFSRLFAHSAPRARRALELLGNTSGPGRARLVEPLEIARSIAAVGVRLYAHMSAASDRVLPLGRQRAAIAQIAAHPGIRPAQLSSALGVTRGGAAYVIDQLRAAGMIERLRGAVADDARAVVLSLTPAGARVADLLADAVVDQRAPLTALCEAIAAYGADDA